MNIQINIAPASAFTKPANMVAVEFQRPKMIAVIGEFTPGKPAVPAVPEFGIRGHTPDYRPPVAEIPATPDRIDGHRGVEIELTEDEWNNWPAGDEAADTAYLRSIALARLNYTAK